MFDWSRNAHSSAANTIASGLLRPIRAMPMPVNPMPAGKLSEYWCDSPSRFGRPTRPAIAPDPIIVMMTILRTLTPLAAAADSERPAARRSNPNRVRETMNW